MLPDWAADTVYVSDLLPKRHPDISVNFSRVLTGHDIPYYQIEHTKDIWCRDYMPIQVGDERYVQFTYDPDYLVNYEHLKTPPLTKHPTTRFVLDGGNIVGCRGTVIVTDKIYKENPTLSRGEIRTHLEAIFRCRVIIIPKPPFDYIGHSDGVVRFIDEQTVIVNECSKEEKPYGDKVVALLRKNGLQVELFPYYYLPPPKNKCDIDTAVGVYMNFLWVGNVVILPSFDIPLDDRACRRIEQLLPTVSIHQVPATRLAEAGGVFNCVTWTTWEGRANGRTQSTDTESAEDPQLPHEFSLHHACR